MNLSGRESVCPYRDRLGAFWDAEVSPEERQRIEAHLSECAACRQHLQELQSLAAALKAYRTPAPHTLPIPPTTRAVPPSRSTFVARDERRQAAAVGLNEGAVAGKQGGVPRTRDAVRPAGAKTPDGGVPAGGWPSDAEFWHSLAPQLRPRAIPAQESQAKQPSPFLAPVSLVVSSLALRGVAALVLIAYALYQWQLLPAAVPAAFAPAVQLALGPWVWQRSQFLYSNLFTSLAPFLAAPGQVWLLAFEATTSALLLLIAGLHTVWLLRWLRNPSSLQVMMATE